MSVSIKALFPFWRYPLHRHEGYRPFFIIGSGRSGNTLLRRILNNHSSLYIPSETYVLGSAIKVYRQTAHMKWNYIVSLVYSLFQFHPEVKAFQVDTLFKLVENVKTAPREKRSLAYLINSFYQWHAKEIGVGYDRWGDKTPINVFALERIYHVFPDAQFIHIIRDGCDVVASYLVSGIYSELDAAAWRWRTSVNLSRRFGKNHPRAYLEIRYEDLVTNTRNTVETVCKFLGVKFEENMLLCKDNLPVNDDMRIRAHLQDVLKPITLVNIGKGHKQLTKEQKELLDRMIRNDLENLGYPPCV